MCTRPIKLEVCTFFLLFSNFLVFSSGAQAARGQRRGEGIHGFARAMLSGGIPCLIASKWDVPTRESIELMVRFYAHMAINRVRKRYDMMRARSHSHLKQQQERIFRILGLSWCHSYTLILFAIYVLFSLSLSLLFHLRASVANQDRYQSVAEAFQAALQSLIHNPKFRYKDSFYYWGAFLPHGFADVQLDKQLLDQIHSVILQVARQKGVDTVEMEEDAIEFVMRALTREAHEDYDNREETMRVRLHDASEM